MTGYTKKALIRREGYPVGTPAPMFLRCVCAREIDMEHGRAVTCMGCGRTWDPRGWLTNADSTSITKEGK